MSERPIYSARDIRKDYRMNRVVIPVLKGLNLDIHREEIVAIVGQSGVGKSTLLNILGLLDVPTAGTLLYEGRDEAARGLDLARLDLQGKARIRNREFGFVFQFYHLLPDLNVIENVMLPVMIRKSRSEFRAGRAESVRKAEDLLERVGILARKDFFPAQLSGGERQRAAIARALMNDPQIVFCDEPTGNLDTVTGDRIHGLILELNRALSVSFILVTHDEGLASLGHRRLHMRDGVFVGEDDAT
jgi:lipoprotein-releasing system ATP-binding protein